MGPIKLGSINITSFSDFFWPIVFIIIGVVKLTDGKYSSSIRWLCVGVFLMILKIFGFWSFSVFISGLLIILGLSMILDRSIFNLKIFTNDKSTTKDEDKVSISSAFSGVERQIITKDFKGGLINCAFGAVKLDLRNIELTEDTDIDINVAFGGVEILVSDKYKVVSSGTPFMGGWTNKQTGDFNKDVKILKVSGIALFGGVEIK